jgi:hypothetical protein
VRVELIAVGIGGGGMTTVVSILFSDIVPLRERGVWYVQCPFFSKHSSWLVSRAMINSLAPNITLGSQGIDGSPLLT